MRAYSYLRFSSPEQAKGDSERRQEALATAYAHSHGLDLDDKLTFQDRGVSAYHGRNVEEGRLADFLKAVETGRVEQGSYLLVESLDRISRETPRKAFNTLQRIIAGGITLVTLTDGRRYSEETLDDDPFALMSFVMMSARANEESKTKGLRVRAAWDAKRARAADEPLTRWGPAWLKLKDDRSSFEVIPARGEVVRRIFEMAAGGMGQHAIAAKLNAEGVPTFGDEGRRAAAVHWHRSYISKILNGPAALGIYVPHVSSYDGGRLVRTPQAPVPNYYPVIVDAETARRARLVGGPGENPRRGRHAAAPVQSILAGLARCPICEGTMTRVTKGSSKRAGRPYLVCSRAKAGAGCEYRSVVLEDVERAIRERATELIFKDAMDEQDEDLIRLQGELEAAQTEVRNYADAVGGGSSSQTLLNRLVAAEERARHLTEAIAARVSHTQATREPLVEARMADLRDALTAEPFDVSSANTALRLCADHVVVEYRQGQLFVVWRHGGFTDLFYTWPQGVEG